MARSASKQSVIRDVRVFGATLGSVALVVALVAWRHGFPLGTVLIAAVLAALAGFAIVAPRAARPLQLGWLAVGHALGRVTTPIVLTIVFVFVFTPAHLLLALFGRDPLKRRREPSRRTYWTDRVRTTFTREDFEQLS